MSKKNLEKTKTKTRSLPPSPFLVILQKDTTQNQETKRAQSPVFLVRFQYTVILLPVLQKMDSALHWINHYPLDKC